MSSPVCMACVPASYVDLECKHLFESADVAAAGAQGCSCDSLVYVYLRREQDGVHCLSNLTKIKNNIGNVYSSHCVHIHHVYSSPCVHIHHVYSSTSLIEFEALSVKNKKLWSLCIQTARMILNSKYRSEEKKSTKFNYNGKPKNKKSPVLTQIVILFALKLYM